MNNISMAFLLTIIAGFSTLIGTIPIFINLKNENKIIAASLSFAAGVMICVSVTDLVPESLNMLSNFNDALMIILCFLFILIGIIISTLIDKALPTKTSNNSLYKVGIISMLAIIIHNIPEGISISVPIYYSTKSKFKAFLYAFISALSEPFGALITYLFLINYINDTILGLLFSLIAGIMIQISLSELLPTSKSYNLPKLTKIFFTIGVIFMLLKFII